MEDIIILLKTLNLYAHNAHNLASRLVFNQDHEMLLEIYEAADTNYDDVLERLIGLKGDVDNIAQMDLTAAQHNTSLSQGSDNATKLKVCLELEKAICQKIEILIRSKQVSVGTEQLLGDICNTSEVRQYKMTRRLMK